MVCRELRTSAKDSDLKRGAVCICSRPCDTEISASVCDAARATSAAPTYFPRMQIEDRYFVDGGMEYNNPTFAIFEHYTRNSRVQRARQSSADVLHGNLNITSARFVNIGTGSKTSETPDRRREAFARFIPGFIRTGALLKPTLTECAIESEKTAEIMRCFSALDGTLYLYERFSATNGVCWIKLDAYKKKQMQAMERLTRSFLKTRSTQSSLDRVAREIAEEYLLQYY